MLFKIQPISIRFAIFAILTLIAALIANFSVASVRADSYPLLVVSPESIDFGSVAVGESSSPELLTVTNDPGATFGLAIPEEIILDGEDAGSYLITNDNLSGRFIITGVSDTLEIAFVPDSPGPKEADLIIVSNATYTLELTTFRVALSGEGIDITKTNPANDSTGSVTDGEVPSPQPSGSNFPWPVVIYSLAGAALLTGLLYFFWISRGKKMRS